MRLRAISLVIKRPLAALKILAFCWYSASRLTYAMLKNSKNLKVINAQEKKGAIFGLDHL